MFTFCITFLAILNRKVRKNEGMTLADQYDALYEEVSAAEGTNVEEALFELAKQLREREDLDIQNALKLSLEKSGDGKKNKSCCGGGSKNRRKS